MKTVHKRCVFVAIFLVSSQLSSCQRPDSSMATQRDPATASSVGPTSGRHDNGASSSSEAAAIAALQSRIEEIEKIDAQYSRPIPPGTTAEKNRVTAVEADGRLLLDNGNAVVLAGVSCSQEGIGYVARAVMSQNVQVAVRMVAPPSPKGTPAEIWLIDSSSVETGNSPSQSLIAETALTSGWCTPNNSANESTNARFRALSKLAPSKSGIGR